MTHGSLFSGIGGFDLAARWAGFENKWQVEIDPWCRRLLKQNFPEAIQYGDIRTVGAHNLERVDIISGGFPCQPFSVAGKQKGRDDNRFLWPEMLRVIREMRPYVVVGENVTGIINMELDQVLTDLENEDYTCETFIIPACAVNAPHRRDRVWIIAYSDSERLQSGRKNGRSIPNIKKRIQDNRKTHRLGSLGSATNPYSERCQKFDPSEESSEQEFTSCEDHAAWTNWPNQPGVCRGNDGLPHRLDRLKGLGNAIVPELALVIFLLIKYKTEENNV